MNEQNTSPATVKFAVCNRKTDKRYKNREVKWGYLVQRCRTPIYTSETVQEYPKLSKASRDAAKDVGGFVGGQLKNGIRRNGHVLCRSIGTLDADHINGASENTAFLDQLRTSLHDTTYFIYSTHSHTPEAPRYRVVILFSRDVTEEEYPAVMRMIAHEIGMDYFDDSTYQSNRMMYWPSCPSNGEFFFDSKYGEPLNPDYYLNRYHDWRNVSEWPMSSRQSEIISRRCKDGSTKRSAPTDKDGIVGAFCSAYPISAAIDKFLPDIYAPTASQNRYDYIPSDSIAGVMVFDDMFVYSFHASDPACGQELNAFDLVRVHMFPDADEKKSFKAMAEFASKDTEVKKALLAQRQKTLQSDFSVLPTEASTPANNTSDSDDADTSWQDALEYTQKGELKNTLRNITIILGNDPKLKNIIFNQLADNMEIVGEVPWKHPTRFWRDADDSQLISYIEFNYGSFSQRNYEVAVTKVADDRSYHPIREMFASLPAWDGVKRVDSLLIDYLGAEDNEYVRAVTRKALCAAYMRVHHPGIKFDTIVVLNGSQGIGKSTLIALLGGDWFNDSLNISDMESKAAAEKLQGYWILEIGEMAGMKKTDIEKVKAFISRQDDKYRAAFGRRVTPHPRQCIFFGTTNSRNGYLRDITGNRRFWNVKVDGNGKYKPWQLDKVTIAQIWAEVKVLAEKGERLYLDAALEEFARQEQCDAMEQDEREGLVRDYLDVPLPNNWDSMDAYDRMNYIQNPNGIGKEKGTIQRTAVSNIEIWCECFGKRREDLRAADSYAISAIMMRIKEWERTDIRKKCGPYGELVVNEEEAEIVREIYRLFLSGFTPHGIGKELTARHIPTPGGKVKWTASTVKSILTNEKYKGDALLQKTFTPDYLTKKTKKNEGQIPQYYVENSHPAIITAEIFDAVQTEMERRQGTKSRYSGVDILASKLVCGECGSSYRSKVWHSTDQYRRTIYQCGHKYKDGCKCSTPNLTAEAIHTAFICSFNEMITNKNEIIRNLRESIALASDMTELKSKRDAANNEVLFLADIVEKLIAENARIPQDQKEYNKKYKTAIERYEAAKASYDSIIAQIAEEHKRIQRMKSFIQNVQKLGVITEFDETLWGLLVDKVVVYSKDDIRVVFKK